MSTRTVNDFNREYEQKLILDAIDEAKKPRKAAPIKSAVFYLFLILLVLFVFFYVNGSGTGMRFGPFSYSVVLSESMQSVYPKGSLITTYAIKPDTPLEAGLENGTDIVFVTTGEIRVVHRIIEIFENYENTGQRAFRTQGVNNQNPDADIVYEANVVGRVTWHSPYLGAALNFISSNIIWAVFIVAGITALITCLAIVFKKEEMA